MVLFFLVGVVKTCGSFTEIKRPEQALKLFVRFVLSKAVVTYGLDLMMALFNVVQGIISTATSAAEWTLRRRLRSLPKWIRQYVTCHF